MSAAGRGAIRQPDDFYATPAWCVDALLRGCALPSGRWLEPTAGDGAIVGEVLRYRRDVLWHLVESRAEELQAGGGLLARVLCPDFPAECVDAIEIRDFLTMLVGGKTDATEYAWFLWDGKPSRVVIL